MENAAMDSMWCCVPDLDEMCSPCMSMEPSQKLAQYNEWGEIGKKFLACYSDRDADHWHLPAGHDDTVKDHRCERCGCAFATQKALALHMNRKHGVKTKFSQYIDATLKCRICKNEYSTYKVLYQHLKYSSNRGCGFKLLAGGYTPATEEEIQEAARLNRVQLKEGRKAGKSGMPVPFRVKRRRLNHDEKTMSPVRSMVASLEVIGGGKKLLPRTRLSSKTTIHGTPSLL